MNLNRLKCAIYQLYLNVRYFKEGWMQDSIFEGHDLVFTGEVCEDHWHMKCKRCGKKLASDVGPGADGGLQHE